MSAHIVSDTACLPVLTSCSCLQSQVRPAAQIQRLPQRTSGVFSAKHACQVPRRRTGRNSIKVFARAAQEQRTQVQLPEGYVRYETMIVLRPDMSDENRDIELAKFEAFLNREQCKEIKALVRGRQQLAYPIKGFWEGIYVLSSKHRCVQQLHQLRNAQPVFHVGAPLTVWDKRQMSHAVYEEEYLGNFPKTETFTDAEVPLPLPDRAADHQGLYLSTDGDQLLGRADNGMMWLWDLSSCLGWQKGGPTGLWMQDNQVRQLAAQQPHSDPLQPSHTLPYQAGFQQRWPDMLGSLPYWDGLPKVCLRNGRTCPVIATSSRSSAEIPSICTEMYQWLKEY
ncbi:hypothetical protein WJX82_009684 [Trebouxia sp. C0006]